MGDLSSWCTFDGLTRPAGMPDDELPSVYTAVLNYVAWGAHRGLGK